MVFLLFTNILPLAFRRTLLQPTDTSAGICELHLTIFNMRVQYVCVIRNVHVEYTDHLPRVISLAEVAQYFLELTSPVNSDYNLDDCMT